MRKNTLLTLGASAAFGVLSIFLAKAWIDDAVRTELDVLPAQAEQLSGPKVNTVKVIVADAAFDYGDEITPQNLRLVDMPEDLVPANSFSSFEALFVDDAPIVVLGYTEFNEPIIAHKISGPHGRRAMSQLVSEGMRAVSIRSNATSGVAGFVLPGDRVDILLTRDVSEPKDERELQTELLLQDVKVLGVDQNALQTSDVVDVSKTVTLEVTPEQAQVLTLAMDVGSLSLTLRRAGSLDVQPEIRVSEETLKPVAAKPVYRPTTRRVASRSVTKKPAKSDTAKVTIIRSGKRSEVSVRREDEAATPAPIQLNNTQSEAAPSPQTAPAITEDITLVGGNVSGQAFDGEEG